MAGKTKSCLAQDVLSLFLSLFIYIVVKRDKSKRKLTFYHTLENV